MTATLRATAVVLAAAVLLALAGCGGDNAPAVAQDTTTPEPTAAETTPAAEPTTAAPTVKPTATPSAVPTRPVKVPAIDGDIDGDGKKDTVVVSKSPIAEGVWGVTLQLSAVGVRRGQIHAEADQPHLVGVVDADGDGYGEVWLTVAQGASTSFWGALRLVDGVVREVTLNGDPMHLGIGGSVTHGDGFACRDDVKANRGRELVIYSGDTYDGVTWEGTVTTYAWTKGSVSQLRERTETFPVGAAGDDPRLRPYYDADCGSLAG